MLQIPHFDEIEYLIVGHLALDITPQGKRLGGTAAYSSLTARALGLKVGLVTSWGTDAEIDILLERGVQIAIIPAPQPTTFENRITPEGRTQRIMGVAQPLRYNHIPVEWRNAPLVHLGPIAQEVDVKLSAEFSNSLVVATAQGWLRRWDGSGNVFSSPWEAMLPVLRQNCILILSEEDIHNDQAAILAIAAETRYLIVTRGALGVWFFVLGQRHAVHAPVVDEVDATGAGDIFATAFAIHYQRKQNLMEAVTFANTLAAASVTRRWLESIPRPDEVETGKYLLS